MTKRLVFTLFDDDYTSDISDIINKNKRPRISFDTISDNIVQPCNVINTFNVINTVNTINSVSTANVITESPLLKRVNSTIVTLKPNNIFGPSSTSRNQTLNKLDIGIASPIKNKENSGVTSPIKPTNNKNCDVTSPTKPPNNQDNSDVTSTTKPPNNQENSNVTSPIKPPNNKENSDDANDVNDKTIISYEDDDWRPIVEFVDAEINVKGIVRRISNKTLFTLHNNSIEAYLASNGKSTCRSIPKLLRKIFPPVKVALDPIDEEWRIIKDCPMHQVSNYGRIRFIKDLCIRKLSLKRGYARISIADKHYFAHTLVAKAFLPPPGPGQNSVNHKNGVKNDNHVTNLEWASPVEQAVHANANGLIDKTNCSRRIQQSRGPHVIASFKSLAEASRKTGFPIKSIANVCNKLNQSYNNYQFSFEGKPLHTYTNEEQNAYIWTSIEEYPMYEICKEGLVRNKKTHLILAHQFIENEYIKVMLSKEGKKKPRPLHILLAKTFLPNPHNFPVVHHIDENKTNNDLSNLQYVTQQQNAEASLAKAVFQYDDKMQVIHSWPSLVKASVDVGVSEATLALYMLKSKVHDGFMYSYDGELASNQNVLVECIV